MGIITFLSDFGAGSGYPAAMKAVAASISDARLVDVSHDVAKHEIRDGAFLLLMVVPYFPDGTVHVAVVDPGVGTRRRPLIIKARNQYLVGPDNGLLIPAARRLGDFQVFEITNRKYLLPEPSQTFHGRDLFAPVAGYLANGVPPTEIGERREEFVDFGFGLGEVVDGDLVGRVIFVDNFGNMVTNIPRSLALEHLKFDEPRVVRFRGRDHPTRLLQTYGLGERGELLMTIGSHDFLELAVNQGSAKGLLSADLDSLVRVVRPGQT